MTTKPTPEGETPALQPSTAPNYVRDALQFIHDTFKRDLDAGYKTRDKEFAIEIAAEALSHPEKLPSAPDGDSPVIADLTRKLNTLPLARSDERLDIAMQIDILKRTEQPSPARSDKDADLHAVAIEAAQVLESAAAHDRSKGRTVLAHSQQERADRLRLALAAQCKLAERAPSGEGIATWNERGDYAPDIQPHTRVERYMQDEINDLRAALARRATAGTTAAPSSEEAALRRLLAYRVAGALLYEDDGELLDNTDSPWIDYRRDSAAEIEAKLIKRGVKELERATAGNAAPTEYNAGLEEAAKACEEFDMHGMALLIRELKRASNTATAAPGDLIYQEHLGGGVWSTESKEEYDLRDPDGESVWQVVVLASNAGAAPLDTDQAT